MPAELLSAYQGVGGLAERQLLALEAEDLDAFWPLTAERDAAFERLQAMEPQAQALTAPEKQAIAELIRAILLADQRIESHLNRFSTDAKKELAQLHNGMTALQSYAVGREREAFFIDQPS